MTAFMSKDNPLSALPGDTLDLSLLKDQPLIVPSRESINDMIYEWFKEIGSFLRKRRPTRRFRF